jgi:hypothetical protein
VKRLSLAAAFVVATVLPAPASAAPASTGSTTDSPTRTVIHSFPAEHTPTQAADDPDPTDAVSLALVDQTRLVRGTENARILLRLTTTGLPDTPRRPKKRNEQGSADSRAPDSPYEVVVLVQNPTVTREAVQGAIDASASGAPLTDVLDVVSIPFADVRLRQGQLSLRVPIELVRSAEDELFLPFPAIYPLIVTVTRDGAPLATLQTFVERLPDGTSTLEPDERGSLDISIVGIVDGAPSLLPNGATRTDPDTVAELRRVTAVLTRLPDVPVTLSLRPEVIEGLDRSREISDRALLAEMASALGSRELLATTYVGLDPSSMVDADLDDVYIAQLRRGEDALAQAFPAAATLRSSAVIDEPLTADGADLLRNLGVRTVLTLPDAQASFSTATDDDTATTTDDDTDTTTDTTTDDGITGSADTTDTINEPVTSGPGPFDDALSTVDLALPTGTLPVLFLDVATTLRIGEPSEDPQLQAHRILADLSAWLTGIAFSGGRYDGHTLVLTTPDGRLPDVDLLEALTTLLEDDPRFSLSSLGTSAATTDGATIDGVPIEIEPADEPARDQEPLAYSLGVTGSDMMTTGSMLPSRDPRPTRWQTLVEIAPSRDLDDTQRSAYFDTVLAETAAIRGSVSGPPRTTFTLGGRRGDITLSLRNDESVPLTVVVRLSSSKLLFPQGPQTEVLAPEATTIVVVPVEARSNNTFPVTVELLTPTDLAPVTPPVQLTARVTAFTGLGQLATGAGAIILATWWARHWRTNRRRRLAQQLAAAPSQHPSRGRPATTSPSGD